MKFESVMRLCSLKSALPSGCFGFLLLFLTNCRFAFLLFLPDPKIRGEQQTAKCCSVCVRWSNAVPSDGWQPESIFIVLQRLEARIRKKQVVVSYQAGGREGVLAVGKDKLASQWTCQTACNMLVGHGNTVQEGGEGGGVCVSIFVAITL